MILFLDEIASRVGMRMDCFIIRVDTIIVTCRVDMMVINHINPIIHRGIMILWNNRTIVSRVVENDRVVALDIIIITITIIITTITITISFTMNLIPTITPIPITFNLITIIITIISQTHLLLISRRYQILLSLHGKISLFCPLPLSQRSQHPLRPQQRHFSPLRRCLHFCATGAATEEMRGDAATERTEIACPNCIDGTLERFSRWRGIGGESGNADDASTHVGDEWTPCDDERRCTREWA